MTLRGNKPHIVIVGAGFAGLFATRGLRRTDAQITLIDRQNYHLFQPLLYQVATAGLAPSDIAWPIRGILNRQQNVTVVLDTVTNVDIEASAAITTNRRIDFDYLVLATGAQHTYFGHDEWAPFAPGLKSIDDATAIRRRILMAFERAESTQDITEQERLLTFVIVGAGPTGVELAGTIAELARRTLARDFRNIDSRRASVVLVEAGPRMLSALSEKSSDYARKALEKLGVRIRLGHAITNCDGHGVVVDGEFVPSATVLWAAGVQASPAGRWLAASSDRAGRVIVEPDLSVRGLPNVFVIGDTSAVYDKNGKPIPGIAPAAKQQGRFVAKVIRARLTNTAVPAVFEYRHFGNLATIGRKSAVIELPCMRLSGFLAWWIWGVAHIYFLIGVRSPLLVALNWLRQYMTYGRGARLITGGTENSDNAADVPIENAS